MSSEFDRYAQTYSGVLAGALGRQFGDIDRFAAYKVEEVSHRLAGGDVRRVLDFGCGVGRSLRFLAQAFPEAERFGFDPSEDCIIQARGHDSGATLSAKWPEMQNKQFDCVFAANVFHHIPIAERGAEIRKCADALRAGGSLFIFEHNPYNPATRWVFERCIFDRGASMIPQREMTALGRRVGLHVLRRAYTLFVPFQGKTWSALQRPFGWLPLGAQYYVQFVK